LKKQTNRQTEKQKNRNPHE